MKRQEQYKNLLKFGFSFVIWCEMVAVWAWFWMNDYADIILRPFGYKGNWLVFLLYGILSFFFTNLYGGYRVGYYRRGDVVLSGYIAVLFTNGLTYLQTCLVGRGIMTVIPFLKMTACDLLLFFLWATISCELYTKAFPPQRMLVVYKGDDLTTNLVKKMARRTEKYQIQEAISVDAGYDKVCEKILAYSSVILCDTPAKTRNQLLKLCFEQDIRVYTTPKISDILIRSAENITLFDTPLLLNRNHGLSLEQRFIKRTIDIVFAIVMLVITSPLMLIVAILIKAQDGGPVLFKQNRLTQNARIFHVYKFRSMIIDAEKECGAQLAPEGDARITAVGRFIRKVRLDELPQLWNILVGDMSVVGPRPERPEIAVQYLEFIPEFTYRLKVRAGLTGYAQVVGKYNTTPYDKLKMDLMYIAGYSLLLDLKIMFMTFKILFVKESTEGMRK